MRRKEIILIIYLLLLILKLSANEESTSLELIKRTVAILPFHNVKDNKEYNYLSDTIRNAFKAELSNTDNFLFTSFSDIDDEIENKSLEINKAIKEKYAKQTAFNTGADVVAVGKYIIVDKKILIQIEVYDIFKDNLIVSSSIHTDLGLDVFDIIDEITKDISVKMNKSLGKIEKSYFDEMMRLLEKQNKITKKANLTVSNKIGISFIALGGSLLLMGSGLLIYDLAGYSEIMTEKRSIYNENPNSTNYQTAQNSIDIFRGLFAGSIVIMACGVIFLSIGIPLLVVKKKKHDISLNIHIHEKVNLYFQIKI